MEKKQPLKASLGDVAKAAGISRVAASFALRNRPGVSKATRKRVLRIAKQLGYVPDARIASWMARMREAKAKDMLPIIWLNTNPEEDAWHKYSFLSPFLEGARERCHQLGYRIDEIWARHPGVTMQGISKMLDQRGIEGVIVPHPAMQLGLNFDHRAGVFLGGSLLEPRLHLVTANINFNLMLAVRSLRQMGYDRIGISLAEEVDRHSDHTVRAIAHYFHSDLKSNAIPPLFYPGESLIDWRRSREQFAVWLRRYKPEVVVGHSGFLLAWVQYAGYRVPEEIGVVHLAIDDDVLDWAGIHSNKRALGRAAAEEVVSLIQNRHFGVPETALEILIRGTWHPGRTLLIPKPAQLTLK